MMMQISWTPYVIYTHILRKGIILELNKFRYGIPPTTNTTIHTIWTITNSPLFRLKLLISSMMLYTLTMLRGITLIRLLWGILLTYKMFFISYLTYVITILMRIGFIWTLYGLCISLLLIMWAKFIFKTRTNKLLTLFGYLNFISYLCKLNNKLWKHYYYNSLPPNWQFSF